MDQVGGDPNRQVRYADMIKERCPHDVSTPLRIKWRACSILLNRNLGRIKIGFFVVLIKVSNGNAAAR